MGDPCVALGAELFVKHVLTPAMRLRGAKPEGLADTSSGGFPFDSPALRAALANLTRCMELENPDMYVCDLRFVAPAVCRAWRDVLAAPLASEAVPFYAPMVTLESNGRGRVRVTRSTIYTTCPAYWYAADGPVRARSPRRKSTSSGSGRRSYRRSSTATATSSRRESAGNSAGRAS